MQLVDAGGEAGVVFKRDSDGVVDGLSCEKCSGVALLHDAKAKVDATNVK